MIWGSVLVMGAVCTAYTAFVSTLNDFFADFFVALVLSKAHLSAEE